MGIHKLGLLAAISAALAQGSYGFDMCVDMTANFQGATVALAACGEDAKAAGTCNTCAELQGFAFSTAGGVATFDACTTPVPAIGTTLYFLSATLQGECCGGAPTSCGEYGSAPKVCANPDDFTSSKLIDPDDDVPETCSVINFFLPMTGILAPNLENTGYADFDCTSEVPSEFFDMGPQFSEIPKRVADLVGYFGSECCGEAEVACEAERSFTNFCTTDANFSPSYLTLNPDGSGSQITCDEVSKMLPLHIAQNGGSPAMKNGVLTASDCTLDFEEDADEPTFKDLVALFTTDCCTGENPDFNVCHNAIVNENPPCNTADDCYDAVRFFCDIAPDSRRRKLFGMNKYKGVCVESTPP